MFIKFFSIFIFLFAFLLVPPVYAQNCCRGNDTYNSTTGKCEFSTPSGPQTYTVCDSDPSLSCNNTVTPPRCERITLGGRNPGEQVDSQTGSNPTLDKIFGVVNHPSQLDYLFKGLNADQGITALLSKVVELIYIFAAVVFVFYILYSGIEFIYSEGHKESIAEARGRIIWAIIGIVILALAFVFLKVLGYITNFKFFGP